MVLRFDPAPGRWERHLARRHLNPLFGDPPPEFDSEELERARRRDAEEVATFDEEFKALVQQIADLKPNEDSTVILELKERLDQAYERVCSLGGDQARIKAAIRQLIQVIMAAVRKGAGSDIQALAELDQEDEARAMHYALLEHPLVADVLDPQSAITPEELLPSLLSADEQAMAIVLGLLDAPMIETLARDSVPLRQRLEAANRLSPELESRFSRLGSYPGLH